MSIRQLQEDARQRGQEEEEGGKQTGQKSMWVWKFTAPEEKKKNTEGEEINNISHPARTRSAVVTTG